MKAVGYALALVFAAAPSTFAPEPRATPRVRPPALAGGWYPEGRAALTAAAHLMMRTATVEETAPVRPVALVVPHAGWSYSGPVAGAAFRLLKPGDFDRVVVMGPSHYEGFRGYALDDMSAYRTPIGDVPLCDGVLATLHARDARPRPTATGPEHSVEIELPFLQAALDRFCLVPVVVGSTTPDDERAFAERLAQLDDGRTLFVFSSDFAHYGRRFDYQPFGRLSEGTREKIRELNGRAISVLSRIDAVGFRNYLHRTGNTICGRNALKTMLELLRRIAPKATALTLAHYASADIAGMRDDSSVSYVAMAFLRAPSGAAITPLVAPPQFHDPPSDKPALSAEMGVRLVRLARAALRTELQGANDLQRELAAFPRGREHERQGVFVTLNRTDPAEIRKHGRLRGCIGQPEPTFPLAYETVRAALDAAFRDSRFQAVTAAELPRLAVEVTVLSPRRLIPSYHAIRAGTHGVVLEKHGRSALFLPQVASEQGWSVEQMLGALAQKAGLPTDAWRQGARLSVFTGQVFEEHP